MRSCDCLGHLGCLTGSTDTQCKWTRAKKALKDVLCKPLLELILDLLPKDPMAIRMRFQPILKEDRAAIERGIGPDGDEVYSTMFDIYWVKKVNAQAHPERGMRADAALGRGAFRPKAKVAPQGGLDAAAGASVAPMQVEPVSLPPLTFSVSGATGAVGETSSLQHYDAAGNSLGPDSSPVMSPACAGKIFTTALQTPLDSATTAPMDVTEEDTTPASGAVGKQNEKERKNCTSYRGIV